MSQDDEGYPDAWPADFNDSGTSNGPDIGKYSAAYGKPISQGPFGGIPSIRFDLVASGVINGPDVAKAGAYYGKKCPWP
jgi:hypothetical protein